MRDRNVLTLGERLEVEAVVEAAFAPLRARHTDLSPLRVRAAVRWGRGAPKASPQAVRWSGAIARLSELSVAVGMSVVIFGAALAPATGDRSVPEPTETPLSAKALTVTLIAQEREIRALRVEWLETLRARVEALRVDRYIPFQDWLDPTITRPVVRRLDVPAPGSDVVGQSGPY